MTDAEQLERCGFCGSYFKGNQYCSASDLKKMTQKELDNAPLGYCPNAEYEANEHQGGQNIRYVTKDMAIDAGIPELEGTQL